MRSLPYRQSPLAYLIAAVLAVAWFSALFGVPAQVHGETPEEKAAPPLRLYVAPDGDDSNPGNSEAPFAAISKARDRLRALRNAGVNREVVVHIAGGRYELTEPLVFGPEDTRTSEHPATFRGDPDDPPVISGGRPITGWESAGEGLWQAKLPEDVRETWRFRQLFRDGERLTRSRFPNEGSYLTLEEVSEDLKQMTLGKELPEPITAETHAELVVIQNWSIARVQISEADGTSLKTASPVGWVGHISATRATNGKAAFVEHARAFVDQPGEWYLDHTTGVITYMAGEDEDPNEHEFIAPRLDTLLEVRGEPENPVQHLRFEGLEFAHAAWELPSFGYRGIQAGHYGTDMESPCHVLPGAIRFTHARHCRLERSTVAHTGASGVVFGRGCDENRINGCQFVDIGGNGVMVGWREDMHEWKVKENSTLDLDWPNSADVPRGNVISNCEVRQNGAVQFGSVAIYDGYCSGTQITHNWVHDTPYTGISIGFRWNESETSQRDCLVAWNRIHNVMRILADGGGIYTLGYQPGTILRGNLIHDVQRSEIAHGGAPNNGIFFDQGSKGYLIEGNIIYHTSGEPIRFNQSSKEAMTWEGNYFGVQGGDPSFPEDQAEDAGPLAEYMDAFQGSEGQD